MAATLPASPYPESEAMERALPRGEPPLRRPNAPWADTVFSALAHGAALLTLALLAGIIVSLVVGAMPAIRQYGLGFLVSKDWDPVQLKFGGLVMIYGTVATSLIALVIAVPVSFGIALFLTELSPGWLKRPLGIAIELLAAVPSIVYGMWGLLVFGPILATWVQQPLQAAFGSTPWLGALFSGPPVGIGVLSAGIILAIMIIPFIAATMRDVFDVTPPMLKESAYGLGSTTWEVVWKVVLPYTKTGVVSNTSRITEAMKGMIMMARITPAARMPMPTGGPENRAPSTGTCPNAACSGCCTQVARSGPNTSRPHMP